MAIMRPGPLAGQISGRVGGIVFSRNRGGDYVRNGPSPTNPQTAYQVAVRNALALASTAWKDMTDAQRLAWADWARANPVRNRLGESIRLQGNAAYVALNSRMAWLGNAVYVAPPITSPPDPLLTITGSYDIGAGDFQLAYTTTPLAAGMKLWLLGCRVQSPGVEYVRNKLRHFHTSAAAAASPAACESNFNARFGTPVVGETIFFRAGVVDNATGQLSAMLQTSGVVVST